MQEDLWGTEVEITQSSKRENSHTQSYLTQIKLTSDDCIFFGHTWQPFGMQGEKKCSVCSEVGYCPLCLPVAPKGATPYFCTKHTPKENKVQA